MERSLSYYGFPEYFEEEWERERRGFLRKTFWKIHIIMFLKNKLKQWPRTVVEKDENDFLINDSIVGTSFF